MKDVAGKVAFITGGASGLGLAMANSLSGAGMKVAIADIQDDALAAAKESFAESNADVITIKVDVNDRDAMQAAADETLAAFGKIHVLCNNAGVALSGNIADTSYKDWDWLMGVNLDGVINGMQVFTKLIVDQGEGGHIVNTASMAGVLAMENLSVYNTSKFAVVGLSEAIAQDLAQYNIGVSVLCPSFVKTRIYSSERNRPDELGGVDSSNFFDMGEATDLTDEQQAALNQATGGLLDAAMVGDMVLHAIQENELYIFTHPEFREATMAKAQRMSDSYERWAAWRANQS